MLRLWKMLVPLLAVFAAAPLLAQATARQCPPAEEVGPACLLARQEIGTLGAQPLYWHLDKYASKDAAARAAAPTSTIAEAFGSVWLFTLERKGWHAKGGWQAAVIGPLPAPPASHYAAEYLRSVFSPGMTAPLHVHSGPEAFYAVSGDTCLETPDGVQVGRGPGNHLLIRAGPPMLLMAIGAEPRRGFALILHAADQPPTTMIHDWQPQGGCAKLK